MIVWEKESVVVRSMNFTKVFKVKSSHHIYKMRGLSHAIILCSSPGFAKDVFLRECSCLYISTCRIRLELIAIAYGFTITDKVHEGTKSDCPLPILIVCFWGCVCDGEH